MSLLGLLLTTAFAQEPMTTRDVIDCSAAQVLRLEKEPLLQAQGTLSATEGKFLPQLTATSYRTRVQQYGTTTSTDVLSASIEQKLFDAGTYSAKDALKATVKSAEFSLSQKTYELTIQAFDSIVNLQKLIEQKNLIDLQRESFAAMEKVLSVANKVGLSDSNDYLQVKSVLLANEADLKTIAFEIKKAQDLFLTRFGFTAPTLQDIKASASDKKMNLELLPAIKELKAQVTEAQLQHTQKIRSLWPTISASASYTGARINDAGSSAYPTSDQTLKLVLDLSGLWQESGSRSAISAIAIQRQNNLQQKIQSLQQEFSQLNEEENLIQQQIPLFEQRVQISTKSRDVSKAKLKLGHLSFLELQQTEETIFRASQDLSSAQLRLRQLQLIRDLAEVFSDEGRPSFQRCRLQK